jgi:thioredoxin-related protein
MYGNFIVYKKNTAMKRICLFLIPVLAMVAASFTTADPLPIGGSLPMAGTKMKDVNGKMISFTDAKKSNGLLVMFSCNTCPYVIKNQERIKAICAFAQRKKIGVIILNSNEANRGDADSFDAMAAYAKAQGYEWHYTMDNNSEIANAFGANRTPECFLFDKTDKLAYHGAIDNNPSDASAVTREHLKEAINEMAAEMDVTVKESRSVGCTIKRKS